MDKTLLDPPETAPDRPAPSPMPPPSTPDNSSSNQGGNTPSGGDKAPSTPKSDSGTYDLLREAFSIYLIRFLDLGDNSGKDIVAPTVSSIMEAAHDEDEQQAPSVIIYMVEPFSLGCDQTDLQRLACLALLRCFQSVLTSVPENIRSNISVQVRFAFFEISFLIYRLLNMFFFFRLSLRKALWSLVNLEIGPDKVII